MGRCYVLCSNEFASLVWIWAGAMCCALMSLLYSCGYVLCLIVWIWVVDMCCALRETRMKEGGREGREQDARI